MRDKWPVGTLLHLRDGTEYTITASNEAGGTALIYFAKKHGSGIRTVLKEAFPLDWVRHCGVPVPPKYSDLAEDDPALRSCYTFLREQAAREMTISQAVADNTLQVQPLRTLLDIQWIREPDGTLWEMPDALSCCILEMDDLNHPDGRWLKDILREAMEPNSPEHPLGNLQPDSEQLLAVPPLPLTLDIVWHLLSLLEKLHHAGYLHGDINLGNVFLTMDHTGKKVLSAQLIDFGSARPLTDGRTAPLGQEDVMATAGFCAPELWGDGEQQLTSKADVYSAGKLLHCLLDQNTLEAMRCGWNDSFLCELDSTAPRYDSRISPSIQKALDQILAGAAREDPAARSSAQEMMEQVDQLRRKLAPPPWQVSLALPELNSREVLGRDADVAKLEAALREHSAMVLHGFAGIGKTKLVTLLGQDWKKRYPFTQVFYTFFPGSMESLVANTLATNISTVETTETKNGKTVPRASSLVIEDVFRELNAQMRPDDLLIIDNVDDDSRRRWSVLVHDKTLPGQQDLFTHLCALPCRVLFVTRMDISDCKGLVSFPVGKLSPAPLRAILRRYSEDAVRRSDAELDVLLALVRHHTMTVDMIARTLQESRLTVPEIYAELKQGHYDSDAFAEIEGSDYDERRIEGHLICLFRLARFGETEQSVLRCARLISENYGMRETLFLSCCPHATTAENTRNIQALDHLVRLGYIRRETNEDHEVVLRLHTLIRVVAKKEMPLDAAQAAAFLSGMPRAYKTRGVEIRMDDRITVAEAYVLALEAAPQEPFLSGYWASCASAWFHNARQHKTAESFSRMVQYLPAAMRTYRQLTDDASTAGGAAADSKKVLELYWNLWHVLDSATPGLVRQNCGITELARGYWTFCLGEPDRDLPRPVLFDEYRKCGELRAELRKKISEMFRPKDFTDYWVYTDISNDPEEKQIELGMALLERVERRSTEDYENGLRLRKWLIEERDLHCPEWSPDARGEQFRLLVQECQDYLDFLHRQTPPDAKKLASCCSSVCDLYREELKDDGKAEIYATQDFRIELDYLEHPERYKPIRDPWDIEPFCWNILSHEAEWANDPERAMQIYIRLRETCQRAQIELEETPDHPLYERIHQSLQQTVLTAGQRLGKNAPATPYEQRYQEVCRLFNEKQRQRFLSMRQRIKDVKIQKEVSQKPPPTAQEAFLAALRNGTASQTDIEAYRKKFFSELTFRCTGLDDILVTLQETGNEAELLKWLEQTIRWKNSRADSSLEQTLVNDTFSAEDRARFYSGHFDLPYYYLAAAHAARQIGETAKASALAEEIFAILSADCQTVREYSLDWNSDKLLPWLKTCSVYAYDCSVKKQYVRAGNALSTASEDFQAYLDDLNQKLKEPSTDPWGISPAKQEMKNFQEQTEKMFGFLAAQQDALEKVLPKHHPILVVHQRLEIAFCPPGKERTRLRRINVRETLLANLHSWDSWWHTED